MSKRGADDQLTKDIFEQGGFVPTGTDIPVLKASETTMSTRKIAHPRGRLQRGSSAARPRPSPAPASNLFGNLNGVQASPASAPNPFSNINGVQQTPQQTFGSVNGFTFGASNGQSSAFNFQSSGSTSFPFGASTTNSAPQPSTSNSFAFGASTKDSASQPPASSSFTFGAPPKASALQSPASNPFSFGAPTKDSGLQQQSASSSFTFGAPVKDSAPQPQPQPQASNSFTFGTPVKDSVFETKPLASSSFTFGTPAQGSAAQPPAPTFAFGGPDKNPAPQSQPQTFSSFTSGTPAQGSAAQTPAPTFTFGAPLKDSAPQSQPQAFTSFTSGKPAQDSASQPSAPTFTFGAPLKDPAPQPQPQVPSSFTFGTPAKSSASQPSGSASFTDGTLAKDSASEPPVSTTFTFGTPAKAFEPQSPASTPFTFGTPAKSDAPQASASKPFAFGTPAKGAKPQTSASTPFMFGTPAKSPEHQQDVDVMMESPQKQRSVGQAMAGSLADTVEILTPPQDRAPPSKRSIGIEAADPWTQISGTVIAAPEPVQQSIESEGPIIRPRSNAPPFANSSFTPEEFLQNDKTYRLRSLDREFIKRIKAMDCHVHDLAPTVLFYIKIRESIGKPIGGLYARAEAGMKRKAAAPTHDPEENMSPTKRLRAEPQARQASPEKSQSAAPVPSETLTKRKADDPAETLGASMNQAKRVRSEPQPPRGSPEKTTPAAHPPSAPVSKTSNLFSAFVSTPKPAVPDINVSPSLSEGSSRTSEEEQDEEPTETPSKSSSESPILEDAPNNSFKGFLVGSNMFQSTPKAPTLSPFTPVNDLESVTKPTPQSTSVLFGAPPKPGRIPGEGLFGSRQSTPNPEEQTPVPNNVFCGVAKFVANTDDKSLVANNIFGSVAKLVASTDDKSPAFSRNNSPGLTDSESVQTLDTEDEQNDPQASLMQSRPGEENEEVLFEARAKGMKYYSKEAADASTSNVKPNEYNSAGVGEMRVLKNKDNGKSRIVLRTEPSSNVVLNTNLLSSHTYISDDGKGGSVRLPVFTDKAIEKWAVKVKNKEIADELAGILNSNKSA